MTQTTVNDAEVFRLPPEEALAELRAAGLLPARPAEQLWRPDASQVQPAFAPLTTLTPRVPFTPKGYLSATRPDDFHAGTNPNVTMQTRPGVFDGVVWHSFSGVGANRQCIMWVSLRVFGGSSLVIGGTGNPSTLTVTASATGGQQVSIPFGLTATSDGRVYTYLVPALDNMGGQWFSTTLYGL